MRHCTWTHACSVWGPGWWGSAVTFNCDNTGAVAVINCGYPHNIPQILHLLRCLFFIRAHFKSQCMLHDLTAAHHAQIALGLSYRHSAEPPQLEFVSTSVNPAKARLSITPSILMQLRQILQTHARRQDTSAVGSGMWCEQERYIHSCVIGFRVWSSSTSLTWRCTSREYTIPSLFRDSTQCIKTDPLRKGVFIHLGRGSCKKDNSSEEIRSCRSSFSVPALSRADAAGLI